MELVCETCRNVISTEPYIYGCTIENSYHPIPNNTEYKVVAKAKLFCCVCGKLHNYERIEKAISDEEMMGMIRNILPYFTRNRCGVEVE